MVTFPLLCFYYLTLYIIASPSRIRFPSHVRVTMNGISYIQGHVEILHNGEWGTICDDHFDNNDARVICRMVGYSSGQYDGGIYRQTSINKASRIWLDDIRCIGTESHIGNCPHNGWGSHNCGHSEDVGIRCEAGNYLVVKRFKVDPNLNI